MLIAIDEKKIDEINIIQNEILNLLKQEKKEKITLDLMTVKQSAQYLNVSEVLIRKKIERKELPVVRINRAIRIERTELEKLTKA